MEDRPIAKEGDRIGVQAEADDLAGEVPQTMYLIELMNERTLDEMQEE